MSEVDIDADIAGCPYITTIKSMAELSTFTKSHKRCLVMMSMRGCIACNTAAPHLIAAAKKYQKKLWIAYLDITDVGIKTSSVPLFQGFFMGYKLPELTDRGYGEDSLNDLMERLWLTKMGAEKTGEENTEDDE